MLSIRFYIRLILVVLAVTVIVGYTLLEARSLFERNNLVIENPANGAILEREMTNIEGRARNVASISVNGLPVFVDEDGYFAVPYLAAPGYNIVQVALRDKFGRVEKKTVQFIYKK
jgi:uncharacterized protein YfaP (DUF2135 family)